MLSICKYCGEEFKARTSDVKKGDGKFCSISCGLKYRTRPINERFWEKVNKTSDEQCWPYVCGVNKLGYGVFHVKEKHILAHRMAYTLAKGEIPKGKIVLHSCDNPVCCNPSHLSVGTNLDNTRDMDRKGRRGRTFGEAQPNSKLKNDDVLSIREQFNSGVSRSELSKMFKVSHVSICYILKRKTWAHI